MVILGVVLWLVFRSEASARWLGHAGDRAVNWVLHLFHKPSAERIEHSLLNFRRQLIHTVRHRGWLLTLAALGNQVAGFVLVLIIVRAVGVTSGQVGFAAVFTAFAVARLAGAVPITPGGLGTFDAAFITLMKGFGASPSRALTADLIWRLSTYFLPILAGTLTYLIWIRWHDRPAVAAPAAAAE
jgi:uncharacterized protein (TIRG00374 family)